MTDLGMHIPLKMTLANICTDCLTNAGFPYHPSAGVCCQKCGHTKFGRKMKIIIGDWLILKIISEVER